MSMKRSALSVMLIFGMAIIWNGLFHMVLIAEQNELIASIRRPDMSEKVILSLFITIGMATLFVVSYNKWRRSGTLLESLTHGIFFSALAGVLVNANQYLVYPIPGTLAVLWFLGGLIEFSLYSIAIWLVQRHGKPG